ncbi:MAG: T9SS type A sorting domain-containing protein [Gemmatimonadales bacterium]|nr:T9SS type A sorting domain-containing protein [Gemmatimonadales bacterium]
MTFRKFLAICVLTLIVLANNSASADTFSVPDDFDTIAAALNSVDSGDLIQVQPGYYNEHGLILPAGVTLAGAGENPEDTIIDAQLRGNIISCFDDRATSRIVNLTLQNGRARGETSYDKSGGAILVNQGDLQVVDCNFVGNLADAHGGAIRCIQASPEIINCNFMENRAPAGGGGALDCSYNASPLVKDCTFTSNSSAWGGALACRGNSSPKIVAGVFHQNQTSSKLSYGGGALAFFDSSPEFTYCTFYDNRAEYGGALATLPGSPATLTHCTIVENQADHGGGLFSRDSSTNLSNSIVAFQDGTGISGTGSNLPEISCSNIYGNSSGDLDGLKDDMGQSSGNISLDPMFCDFDDQGEVWFSLNLESPCAADATECGTMGAWLAGCENFRNIQPLDHTPRVLTIENLKAAPNPFNPSTRISFELESDQRIRVEIFSIDGKKVRELANRTFLSGVNSLTWNGDDGSGQKVGSGLYIARITGETAVKNRKITLLK